MEHNILIYYYRCNENEFKNHLSQFLNIIFMFLKNDILIVLIITQKEHWPHECDPIAILGSNEGHLSISTVHL